MTAFRFSGVCRDYDVGRYSRYSEVAEMGFLYYWSLALARCANSLDKDFGGLRTQHVWMGV